MLLAALEGRNSPGLADGRQGLPPEPFPRLPLRFNAWAGRLDIEAAPSEWRNAMSPVCN
jgi:hypothetical protein